MTSSRPTPSTPRRRPPARPAASRGGRRPAPAAESSRRWLPAIAAAGVLGVVVVAGMSGKGQGDSGSTGSSAASVAGTAADGSAAAPAAGTDGNPGAVDGTLTVPPVTQANVVVGTTEVPIDKTVWTEAVGKGSYGDEVKQLQQRLTDLGFAPGPVDGAFGDGTSQAVWAYKKLVLGISRFELEKSNSASQITPEVWSAMQDPIVIQPRRPQRGGGTHVEIYLPEQVMVVFTDNVPTLVTHISSGTEETWCEVVEYDTDDQGRPLEEKRVADECGVSITPGGVFRFYRRYEGNRVGALGGMYNPVYFNYGIAVHGAKNVPLQPASHGCIRINMDIAEFFPSLVDNGDYVFVWGQDGKEPEYYSRGVRADKGGSTPIFNYPNPNSTTTTSSSTTTTVASSTSTATTVTATTKPATTTPPVTTGAPATTQAPATTSAPATTQAPQTTSAPTSPAGP